MDQLGPEEVQNKLTEIAVAAEQLGLTILDALDYLQKNFEKRVEILLQFREDLSDEFAIEYLNNLLKRKPSKELLEAVRAKRKKIVLSDHDRHSLEVRQKNKCALCGKPLFRVNKPHVDHIVPISRHGDNSLNNLQILCAQCNLGKGSYLGWPLSAPFYEDRVSAKVRFFALSRAKGKCEIVGCQRSWLDSDLSVHKKIRFSKGGRYVLDNLRILCSQHASEELNTTMLNFRKSAIKCGSKSDEDEYLNVFKRNFKGLSRGNFD